MWFRKKINNCLYLICFSLVFFQSPTNYIDSLQNKREYLEKILHENEGITLHPNHFLLTGVREKLIHTLIAQRSYTESEDEACNLLKYQVEMFNKVADVMGLVDLPRHSTLKSEKMQFREFAFDSLFLIASGQNSFTKNGPNM